MPLQNHCKADNNDLDKLYVITIEVQWYNPCLLHIMNQHLLQAVLILIFNCPIQQGIGLGSKM